MTFDPCLGWKRGLGARTPPLAQPPQGLPDFPVLATVRSIGSAIY